MAIDRMLLKAPVVGIVLRKIAVARFTRTLGTLISSGVPILEGLDITARTSGNAVVEKAISQTRKAVEAGRSLVDPLKETDVFPGMVTQMIGVGEQTGAMDAMLQKIADFYEDEVDAAVKDMLTAIEPIMIVFLGVVVGGVVISMYLPLFSLIGKLARPLIRTRAAACLQALRERRCGRRPDRLCHSGEAHTVKPRVRGRQRDLQWIFTPSVERVAALAGPCSFSRHHVSGWHRCRAAPVDPTPIPRALVRPR